MFKKGIIYVGLVVPIVMIAALPFIIGFLPYFAFDVPLRMGTWATFGVSLLIFPVWIIFSDGIEIILAYFVKNKKLLNGASTVLSALCLTALYYLLISPSLILSILSTLLVFCLFMVIKPWIDKNYQ